MADPLQRQVEEEVERLGFEVVEFEQAGARARPILRLRIDRREPVEGEGVTLDDCTLVSRALEAFLEERADIAERYVLEVSSPGVERPLVRRKDFERFSGQQVAVQSKSAIHEGAKRVEGELLGLEDRDGAEWIRLRTAAGEELTVLRAKTTKINLVYRWG